MQSVKIYIDTLKACALYYWWLFNKIFLTLLIVSISDQCIIIIQQQLNLSEQLSTLMMQLCFDLRPQQTLHTGNDLLHFFRVCFAEEKCEENYGYLQEIFNMRIRSKLEQKPLLIEDATTYSKVYVFDS